jgi:hypothetical protein
MGQWNIFISKSLQAFTWFTTDTPNIQVTLGLILSTQAQSICDKCRETFNRELTLMVHRTNGNTQPRVA